MKPDSLTLTKILLIDSSVREQTSLALVDGEKVTTFVESVRAQELPLLIERFLEQTKTEAKELESLAVVVNGGSVTGIRIGIAVINTLAWLWRKPVIRCSSIDLESAVKYLLEDRNLQRQIALTESV